MKTSEYAEEGQPILCYLEITIIHTWALHSLLDFFSFPVGMCVQDLFL